MRSKLTIVGCGWHAHVAAELAELTHNYSSIEFLDTDWPMKKIWGDWPVVGGLEDLKQDLSSLGGEYFVAMGDNKLRVELCHRIVENGGVLSTLIHPNAFVSPRTRLQRGTVICAGAIVQPYTQIGIGCIVNTGATVDHHCELSDGVHLSPGVHLSGNVRIGARTWLGTGTCVRDKLTIGADIVVGMGSVVVRDLPEVGVYFGFPLQKK
jgi:sugar O-acyltransferase (sialic acid O-acetyltransferase NeuD family)